MTKVLLGDVAEEVREKYQPSNCSPIVVGLENLVPGEIRLKNWNSDNEKNTTFTKAFHKGQILFGRRRAYLKKACVAPSDGICSGDITVISAKPGKILPELLPFVIQNDGFFEYAVGKSAGSLSPRVKWSQLKEYEFQLPEINEQHKLAEVLWQLVDTKEAYKNLLAQTDELVKSRFIELFGDPIAQERDGSFTKVGEVCSLKAGSFVKADDIHSEFNEGLYPCFGGNGCRGYVSDYTHDGNYSIIGRQGALCGNVKYVEGKFHATEHAIVVTPLIPIDNYWLFYLLTLLRLNRYATGAAQPGLTVNNLESIHICVPKLIEQEQFSRLAHQCDKSKFELGEAIKELDAMYKCVIKENLG